MFLLLFLPMVMAKIDSRDGTININELGKLLLQLNCKEKMAEYFDLVMFIAYL